MQLEVLQAISAVEGSELSGSLSVVELEAGPFEGADDH